MAYDGVVRRFVGWFVTELVVYDFVCHCLGTLRDTHFKLEKILYYFKLLIIHKC